MMGGSESEAPAVFVLGLKTCIQVRVLFPPKCRCQLSRAMPERCFLCPLAKQPLCGIARKLQNSYGESRHERSSEHCGAAGRNLGPDGGIKSSGRYYSTIASHQPRIGAVPKRSSKHILLAEFVRTSSRLQQPGLDRKTITESFHGAHPDWTAALR